MEMERKRDERETTEKENEQALSHLKILISLSFPLSNTHSLTVVLACRSISKGAALKRELIEEAQAAAAAARRRNDNSSSSTSTSASSTTLASAAFTPSLEVRQLDVADLDSVRSFLDSWGDRPLHVLVNNAGIFTMGSNKRETTKRDGLESHLATNHLGHFLLTVRLLPCLAEGASSPAAAACASNGSNKKTFFPSRVVSVSSALHAFADGRALAADPQLFVRGYSATAAYANSKLAQVMFTAELRRRIGTSGKVSEQGGGGGGAGGGATATANAAATAEAARRNSSASSSSSASTPPPPIVAVAVHPGEVLTDVVRSLPAPIVKLYRMLMSTLLLTPQEGARAAVFAATASCSSSLGNENGGSDLLASAWNPAKCYLFPDCKPHPPAPSVLDPVLCRWLWGFSAAKVGL